MREPKYPGYTPLSTPSANRGGHRNNLHNILSKGRNRYQKEVGAHAKKRTVTTTTLRQSNRGPGPARAVRTRPKRTVAQKTTPCCQAHPEKSPSA